MPLQDFREHTRAFLKVQDGCDHVCSYCIVPSVRGPERSLPIPEVEKQIQVFMAGGYKEIVLTGINLSRFGRDLPGEINLLTLIRRLKQTPWPARFRLSSVEPQDLSLEVLDELAQWPNFCPHFHIPLQSGSAAVLKAMQRNYRPEDFEYLIQQIYADVSEGCDRSGCDGGFSHGIAGRFSANPGTAGSSAGFLPARFSVFSPSGHAGGPFAACRHQHGSSGTGQRAYGPWGCKKNCLFTSVS